MSNEKTATQITSPVKAIRAKCLDCMCNQVNEVRLCPCEDCALHPFRFGRNPFHTVTLTEEQKTAAAERMKNLRNSTREKN